MNWIIVLGTVIFSSFSWSFFSILSNYKTARKIGLPLIISPVSPLNPLWILIYRAFPVVLTLKYLPLGLGRWARCTAMGWTFHDKHALHQELGPVFTIVTPAGCELSVADPGVALTILLRRKEFIKPAMMYEQLNVFGRNLNTVEGEDWQRQRRLTAPNFNERTSRQVWLESLRQAYDMSQSWVDQGSKGTRETVVDTGTLALHVLTSVGFGLSYPFHGGVRDLPAGRKMTYRDALSLCLRNIITFSILPKKVLFSPFIPKKLRDLGVATKEFQKYMEEMLGHERSKAATREPGTGNLIGSLVRASEEAKRSGDQNSSSYPGLSDEEIFGNIFAFNLAGHETTANTLATSLVLLAATPECQDWLIEGIKATGSGDDLLAWRYEEYFPRLQRCLAVMFETLRLYGSIVFIPKTTGFHTQSITLGDKTYVLPPNTAVNLNVQALHTDPAIWGSDALTWRPNRWLTKSSRTAEETLSEPDPGTYIPWADGPRACVGKKFSQVEFVAVLATLFAQYRVRPALENDESEGEARKALLRMADDSAISAITLQMQHPRSRSLVWERL